MLYTARIIYADTYDSSEKFITQSEVTRGVKSRVSEHYSDPYEECESILKRLGRKHTENDNASIKRAGVALIWSIVVDNYEFNIVYIRQ